MNDRIKKLEEEILKNKNLYYAGKAEISDEEYDKLEEELKVIDPNNYVLSIVGTTAFSTEKVEHDHKMLSLNKTYKVEELIKWMSSHELVGTYKVDGSSCSLIYIEGKLDIAKTRGDGKFGENITNKVFYIDSIPKTINIENPKVEIRGEIYCTEENFINLSEYMDELGLDKPSSLRNIVAGILGRKENIDLSKYLSFQAFELISEDESFIETEKQKFEILESLKFRTPNYKFMKSEKDVKAFLEDTQNFMDNGNYLIDGTVFTYNKVSLHKKLGDTAHHPRYKMAYKVQGETKEAVLNSISWQVSRNGILTPVANIEPVEISGAKISRVTLHNYGMVKVNNLKEQDIIKIVRSGEVIPKFLEVIKGSKEEFKVPANCPSCEQEVKEVDIRLICENNRCPAQVKDNILNFIQKIGIEDLSSKRLEELIKTGMVSSIEDLYQLTEEKLMILDKVKEKLASKLISSINESKKVDLVTFMASLGINGGAYNKCEKIVDAGIDTIEKMKELTVEKLQNIDSFAEKSSTDFLNSFKSKISLVDKLIEEGFNFTVKEKIESKISGQKFCITGSLTMKRSVLQKLIKENSGLAVTSVSKETNYLITNDIESSSSKFKKAKELNIPIINEETFLKML